MSQPPRNDRPRQTSVPITDPIKKRLSAADLKVLEAAGLDESSADYYFAQKQYWEDFYAAKLEKDGWAAKLEVKRAKKLAKAQGIKPGATKLPDATPQTSVAISRPRFEELIARTEVERREVVKRAWFVGAWFLFAFVLALIAFGVQNLAKGGSAFVGVVETPGAYRVAAFVGLGLMIAVGGLWLWGEIRKRHTAEDMGMFMIFTGVAGGLLLLGSYFLDVHIGQLLTTLLWLSSPILSFAGIVVIEDAQPGYVTPPVSPAPQRVQPAPRRENTIYGDARTADDWEVHEALRDKTGGFDPLFKD